MLPAVGWGQARRPMVTPAGAPSLRLVPAPGPVTAHAEAEDDVEGRARVDPGALPDPRRWVALLAQAVVEVLAGRRPVGQVVRWVDPEIVDRLRASSPPQAVGGPPVVVRRVRVSTHLDGSVEAAVVVDDGTRCRALALRLEALSRRWVCTALELV